MDDARLFHGIIHLDHDGVHVHARDYARVLQDLNVDPYIPYNMPVYIPLKRSNPIIFPPSPAHAVISTSFGFVIGSGETKRCMPSMTIMTQRAIKNAALNNAPSISARCQPYEYLGSISVFDTAFRM